MAGLVPAIHVFFQLRAEPLTLPAMRLAHAPLEGVARKIAAESPLPQGERGFLGKAAPFSLSPRGRGWLAADSGEPGEGGTSVNADLTPPRRPWWRRLRCRTWRR